MNLNWQGKPYKNPPITGAELKMIREMYETGANLNDIRAICAEEGHPTRHTNYISRVCKKHGMQRPAGFSPQAHRKGLPKTKNEFPYHRTRRDPL